MLIKHFLTLREGCGVDQTMFPCKIPIENSLNARENSGFVVVVSVSGSRDGLAGRRRSEGKSALFAELNGVRG